ncbi:tRNA lysidine(34) synthetase TilS [Spiroplasma endosymbiont of Crioceris asparagi]|uniref:tRNA lysidine(34) synthetase TilS n=1 Tax=Spiroplasma endosymbiont of Crioceris asparagi TaxID=3066286 RepID=UPI0030CEE1AD
MDSLNNLKIVVGVSGGPDSMFLLNKILKEKKYKDLIVCHVNYHLREESNFDQEIVEKYCKSKNIKLEVLDLNYKTGNVEEWARVQRYYFFQKILKKNNFDVVCVAHIQNDLIETYLIQKQRQNIVNFYGLKKEQHFDKIKVIRPIIEFKKSDILKLLHQENVNYAIDKSNFDTKYLRNKIRKELDESSFEKLLSEIKEKNKAIEIFYKNNTAKFQNNYFNEDILKEMNDLDKQRFIFEWIKFNGFESAIVKRKKKLIKELIKQINSPKNIVFKTNDFTIEKRNKSIFIL